MQKDVVASKNWRRIVSKELIIFTIILIILAMIVHPDLLSSPASRLDRLINTNAASLDHPFKWAFFAYLFIWIFRGLALLAKRFQK